MNQFSAEDISRAKQYIKDDSFQGTPQAEYLAVDVDPLATVGTFQTTWNETTNPLEKDVFETESEYEARIAQMEPVRIGYGVLNTEKKDGYTNVQFLQHHIERNKIIQFVKAPVYFFAQNVPASGVIDGEIVARLRVYNNKVYCDYSRIYLRNGEQDVPIRFICWQKTDYETDADYRKRVEALPILPLGLCMPIRSRYDIEKQQLPFETKRFAYVPFAIPAIYTIPCDRELAKRACMQREPFTVFGNITLNEAMERAIIRGKEIGIVYDNEKELKEQREREEREARERKERERREQEERKRQEKEERERKAREERERKEKEDKAQELNGIGNGYWHEKNYLEAVKYYRQAAEQGYADAQNNLGYCYYKGQGVAQDCREAVKWYRKAAEQGYATAQGWMGYCYEHGQGVQQDYREAVKWYRKAAEQGDADAQNSLGYCYAHGRGVVQDYQEAVKWYRKAAEQGYAGAQNNLGYCYQDGQGVQQDQQEAVKWYRKAAERGDAAAQYNLGFCYQYGCGVQQDQQEAVKWYRKAAERGDSDARRNLENLLAKQKHEQEKRELGETYLNEGNRYWNTGNHEEAEKYFRLAAERGNEGAKAILERIEKSKVRNESQSSKKSSCFITTATCLSFGRGDDCYELTQFRRFRDGYLVEQADGNALIDEYYRIAPQIVAQIDRLADAKAVYHVIWDEYLRPCLKMIESGRMAECKALYVKMVRDLHKKHLNS